MGIFMTRIDKRHVVDIKSKRIQQGLLQTQTAGTWCQTNPTPTQNQTEGGGITLKLQSVGHRNPFCHQHLTHFRTLKKSDSYSPHRKKILLVASHHLHKKEPTVMPSFSFS